MAWKADEGNVVIIPYRTGNPLGKAYGVDNNQDALITFRVYLDKIAMVGPYIFDIIWDRVIFLQKRKNLSIIKTINIEKIKFTIEKSTKN